MQKLPLARNSDIVVQSTGKEILLYDLLTHKAYCLNETSSAVYQACDGETSFDELKISGGLTDDIIFLALDELKRENLLEGSEEYQSPFAGVSRREVIKKIGFASMIALPVISSSVAPTAAMAQSASTLAAPGTRFTGTFPNSGDFNSASNCSAAQRAKCQSGSLGGGSICSCAVDNPCNYNVTCR